jgi:hypothetical protein
MTLGYTCTGGDFGDELFWRQGISRYTRHVTITVHQQGVRELVGCGAVEEMLDGTEHSAADDLLADVENETAVITFTRDYLRPGQALTLRWECR